MLEIIDCDQGSPAWFAARLGVPTASQFGTVMAKGKADGDSKTRLTYMRKLAGEIITGDPMDSFSNGHMQRGKDMEGQARTLYELMNDVEATRVGFMKRAGAGASPDSLVAATGLIEIKTKLAHLQLEVLDANVLPSEHKAQVQGQLWISEREWVDFVSYWPKLELFQIRVYRDEPYIRLIERSVNQFNEELAAMVARRSVTRRAA